MTTASRATRNATSRPGGRSARVRDQVLEAVQAELADTGYDGLTIDGVAARSGVHRTTIYRRWKTVAGLLVDLLEAGVDDTWAPADTGSLEADLVALNREVREALSGDSSVTLAVIAASFRTPEAAEALTRFWDDRYERSAVVVERAITRGEVPGDTAAARVVMAATSPLYHQLVLRRSRMSRAEADQYARDSAAAAIAGLLRH
ncbi:TetR family transcriptional regulator [Kribbella amoyensis]|uniref:TetR family transcriptional regulator n=1 Tax=Kribbella amoyensis TaxID=996641 RepID=A0A561BNU0_9ACTN|nr:TetR/AcrR family transcriptional regulator [Kribbella amoyensis]TWD80462.1 TetR family transcriptional regulator [Kribbella amoyensis]